jgi:signal transduction histidine kinase
LDLNKLTTGLEAILCSVIGDDIKLVMNIHSSELLVRIDPVQYEQVIVNLVVNARDAMPEGGTLTISTGLRAGNGQDDERVVLSVEDSGTGMDSDTKERIFDPFFTTKEVGKGTGLGLSTCYGIVKNADGQIVVSSEPGSGSKFEILLPRGQSAKLQDCA